MNIIILSEYAVLKTNNEKYQNSAKITGKNNYSCYSATFDLHKNFFHQLVTYPIRDRIFIGLSKPSII